MKEGLVGKESRHLGSWRERYLVLRDDDLSTFVETELDRDGQPPKPTERIRLRDQQLAALQLRLESLHAAKLLADEASQYSVLMRESAA